MKLFPPEPDLHIYEEGFGQEDLLGRRAAGQRLSDLLEKVEDPIVVALDGPWGSGKSHFLRRWVGAHQIENGGSATTVYFDAFAHDFLDDPLIGLTSAIGERLPVGRERSKWEGAKRAAFKLARPAFRIGAAVVTAGASELAGPIVDAAIEASSKEAEQAADAFWRREDGRKAAMQQFKSALGKLTELSAEGGSPGRLIVVVDELDRCRPDYALGVLEVIKHFFAVPRVHFVLGVNLNALEHIVRARYGMGVDAADYLKRFISISMRLSDKIAGQGDMRAQIRYFESSALAMGISENIIDDVVYQLKLAAVPSRLSLRDVEKILTRLVLLPRRKDFGNYLTGWKMTVISLVLFKVMRPDLYDSAVDGSLTIESVDDFFGITGPMTDRGRSPGSSYNHSAYVVSGLWRFILTGGAQPEIENKNFSAQFNSFSEFPKTIISDIDRDFFGLFEVTE